MVVRTEPATEISCTQTFPLSILLLLLRFLLCNIIAVKWINQRNYWLLIASPQKTFGIFLDSQWQSSLNASPAECNNNPSAEKIRVGCGSQSPDNDNEWCCIKWDVKQYQELYMESFLIQMECVFVCKLILIILGVILYVREFSYCKNECNTVNLAWL